MNIDCSNVDYFDYSTALGEVINFFEGIDRKYNTEYTEEENGSKEW